MASPDTPAHRILERRKHRRTPLPPGALLSFAPVVPAAEAAEEVEGEGLVLDLSQGGCRVTSDTAIALEKPYSLILQFPYYPNPVAVDSAIVRWVGAGIFGLMFIAMGIKQERYLSEFLEYLRSDAA
ncbi:MAG TPA: PilZ domain-containing protein [Nitrospira sp.]|nr:PilZ domain-containing protein [Nitrospira sp.]